MSYWSKRQDELKEWMEKEEEKLKKRLERYYKTEAKKLNRQIASYYSQYGKDNVIEYRKLMENLDDEDLTLLIQQMDEFAKKYPQYAHLIPVRESIYKLNRLEGLQYSIKMQQLEMGAVTNEEVENYLIELGTKGANSSMEAMGLGKNFYSVNSDIVRGFVNTKWSDGKNFSDTIWQNTDKLSKYLNTDVAQGFARGDSYSKLTKMLTDRFLHVSKNDAYRLIYTEGTYVMAESSMQPFTEDFEQYKISTAKDGKVCSTCSKMAQQVFNISERKAGTNFPPFHPWCRCTFTIHVEDWDKWMEDYKRKKSGSNPKSIANHLSDYAERKKIELSNNEKKAINDYVSSSSYVINEKLRNNLELSAQDRNFVNSLDSALDKMPNYQGNLSRSLYFYSEDAVSLFMSEYIVGKTIIYHEYISTTKGSIYNPEGQVQIYIKNANKGKDISLFNDMEKEVLYQRESSFNIVEIVELENKFYILMEEADE